MSYQLLGPILSLIAAVDLTTYGVAVTVDSNGKAALPSSGGPIIGVTTDKVVAGQAISIQHEEVAQWKVGSGGAVAKGDKVVTNASGHCVTASAAQILAGQAHGIVLEGAAASGMATVLLKVQANGTGGYLGYLDTVLDVGALATAPYCSTVYFSIDGTKTAALPAGVQTGQVLRLQCDAAINIPVGSVTGTFLTQAGAAGTSLAFNAAADEALLVWTGAAWRVITLTSVTLT